jgi:putative ubiquitin-RnfH superfamily antitoxin RatB of RatAB toxin-antitoxin module
MVTQDARVLDAHLESGLLALFARLHLDAVRVGELVHGLKLRLDLGSARAL